MFKFFKGIFGFALAAGLIAFASLRAQAGVVIDNQLYIPLNIKLSVGYTNKSGVIKQARITSKEILKDFYFPEKSRLAIAAGVANPDVVVIAGTSVLNLTRQYPWMVNNSELLDTSSEGKNGQLKYESSGILSFNFYSNPQHLLIGHPPVPDPMPDPAASEAASDYWFEVSGLYFYREKISAVHGSSQNISTSFKAGALSGTGFDVDLDAPNPTTVTGRVSGNGSGNVLIETDN